MQRYEDLQNTFREEFEVLRATSRIKDEAENIHESKERPNWFKDLKPFEIEIQNNQAKPALLYRLAQVYFKFFHDQEGNSPGERLNFKLDNDENLVEAVLSGFTGTLKRDDLPTDKEIIRLFQNNMIHHLSLPFLAGIQEITDRGKFNCQDIDPSILRLAVAFYYIIPLDHYYQSEKQEIQPSWFGWILQTYPKIVADVLEQFTLTTLRSQFKSTRGFYDLAHSKDYEKVAKLTTLKILERFPVRCTSDQLNHLDLLFSAASQHCQPDQILELVNKKLTYRSMNIAQRVYWLTLGFSLVPQSFVEQLDSEVSENERRIRYFGQAVSNRTNGFLSNNSKLDSDQQVKVLTLIIKIVGGSFHPFYPKTNKAVRITSEMTISVKIREFIHELSLIPLNEATLALQELVSNENLKPWRRYLMDASHQQLVNRREASFKYSTPRQIQTTIENKAPANAADLLALTYDYLDEIKTKIRNTNTSDWKQYWNLDGHGRRPLNPRPENTCRDNLLSDLKTKLEIVGIDGQPEGIYANDKRADIRVTFSSYNIPIEIKKSCHMDIWSSIKSQLKSLYTIDPGSDGYGIFLIFWFGDTQDCKPTPSLNGTIPSGPDDLKKKLISSLSSEEKAKIKICVMDVSIPSG